MAFQCIKQFHLIMIEIIFYKYLLTKTIQDDFVNAVKKQKINQKQIQ